MEKNFIQPIQPQLRFGVELNKIFPPWYLHPALKNLIYETRINTERRKEFTLEELFQQEDNTDYRGYQNEVLYLKDRLTTGKCILNLNASPGVHLWLLRNFLGLLPTPLFPKNNIRANSWTNISIQCKDTLIMMRIKSGTSSTLEEIIAREFCDMPPRNLTLIFEVFDLFRSLGTKIFNKTEIDKRSTMAVVRYFTPCLFSRPYRPGVTTTADKRLYALILFTIFNWPTIKEKCQTILTNSVAEFEVSKLYYLPTIKEETESQIQDKINNSLLSDEEILIDINDNNDEEISPIRNDNNNNGVTYLVENYTQTSMQNLANIDVAPNMDENNVILTSCDIAHIALEDVKNSSVERQSSNLAHIDILKDASTKTLTNNENKVENVLLSSNDKIEKEGKKPDSKDVNFIEKKRISVVANLFDVEPHPYEAELIKFDKESSNTRITKDEKIQVSTPKRNIQKVFSSKLSKIKSYKRDSQIIVLNINPCQCCKEKKKKKKPRKSFEVYTDTEEKFYFEEKNNYETPEKARSSEQVQYEHLLDIPNFCCNYTKNINSNFDDARKPYGWTHPCSSLENNGYIYDSFVGSPHRDPEYIGTANYPASNPFIDISPSSKPEVLRDRMAKIGWTYEDRSSSCSPRSKFGGTTSRSDLRNHYKICFDTEDKFGNEDYKKGSHFMSNLKKFGSKLNVFKKLPPKFKRLSVSAENLLSDIKYINLTKRANSI